MIIVLKLSKVCYEMKFINSIKRFLIRQLVSIRSQLILCFLILIILPTSLISYIGYNKSTASLTKKTEEVLEANFKLLNHYIMKEIYMINDTTEQIYLEDTMLDLLSYTPNSTYMYYYNKYTILPYTNTLTRSNQFDNILRSHNFSTNYKYEPKIKLYTYNRNDISGLYKFSSSVFNLDIVQPYEWYLNLSPSSQPSIIYIENVNNSNDLPSGVNYVRKLFGLKNYNLSLSSLITIELPMESINEFLMNIKPTSSSHLYILDNSGRIIASTDKTAVEKMSNETLSSYFSMSKNNYDNHFSTKYLENDNDSPILLSTLSMQEVDWTIIATTPVDEINSDIYKVQNIIKISMIIVIIISLFIALLLARKITEPIKKLVYSMSKLDANNLYVEIEGYNGRDEFSYLIQQYNQTNKKIRRLIRLLSETEKEKKQAELEALQAQINPHFLYNTLDAINWMSMKYNASDISLVVTSLSDFFRFSLSKGKTIIPLYNEIKQTEAYLAIQKIRFPDMIDYEISWDEKIHDALIVKLTIQPIVENAIIHGIEPTGEPGLISISCIQKGNYLIIKISDNGLGTDIEVLNETLKLQKDSKSYGLRNVHERIKNYFGEEYGLKFEDNIPKGVTVSICLPIIKKERIDHVENGDS